MKELYKGCSDERELQQVFVPICPVKGTELRIVDISVV